jgi:phenylpropionate dioxygenase-like ring-hydroxylating dioxygenase large terminal subunit
MVATIAYEASRECLRNFTNEENDILTRVGPGTLMGNLFRQYWIPVIPAAHLPRPGGKPIRIRLLGEDLVAFRTSLGEVGLVGAYCPHRLAPLYYGRVEDDGLRCPYHGWKFAPSGQCIDMPNVPPAQQFRDEVHHPGYRCVEHGGIIWAYMNSSNDLPALPEFEYLTVPDDLRRYRLFYCECNYLQNLEGGIDPTHVMWLHGPYNLSDEAIAERHQPARQRVALKSGTLTPLDVEIADTPGGFIYGARRPFGETKSLWRINQFRLPFYTMPPGEDVRGARMYVPVDDEHSIKWQIGWYPSRRVKESSTEAQRAAFAEEIYDPPTNSVPYGHIRQRARKSNDYLIDWETHETRRMGVAGVNLQDICVAENEGPTAILDRTKELLCAGDLTIIKARRILLQAAKALREHGATPAGVRDPSIYRCRAASLVLPNEVDWVEGAREEVIASSAAG